MVIRALLLDLGGVVYPTPFELHGVAERHYGFPPGTLRWRGPFDPDGDALWQEQQAGRVSERDYWRLRAEEVERMAGRDGGLREYLVACYQDLNAIVRPEVLSVVDDARVAGLLIGVLTNDAELFLGRNLVDRSAFLAAADAFVDGSSTAILKPDRAAYQLALDALRLDAAEVLFVDDQSANVDGAIRAGLPAVRFDPTDVASSVSGIRDRLAALLGGQRQRL